MAVCTRCGSNTQGNFCTTCGAPLASDAPTNQGAGNQHSGQTEAATYYTPQARQNGPFEGYESVPRPNPAYMPLAPEPTADTASAPTSAKKSPLLPALTAVVLVIILALGGYLFLNRSGGSDSSANLTGQSVPSSGTDGGNNPSTLPTSSSSESTSAPTSGATSAPTNSTTDGMSNSTAQPQPSIATATQTQIQVVPADPTPSSSESSSSTASTNGLDSVMSSGTSLGRVNIDGTEYGAVLNGASVDIYEAGGSDATKLSTVELLGDVGEVKFIAVSGCKKPTLVHNTRTTDKGSNAYGWDGSGYQAYFSNGTDLEPTAGNGSGIHAYGVKVNDRGGVQYRDTKKSTPHQFDSCTDASNWDVLKLTRSGS